MQWPLKLAGSFPLIPSYLPISLTDMAFPFNMYPAMGYPAMSQFMMPGLMLGNSLTEATLAPKVTLMEAATIFGLGGGSPMAPSLFNSVNHTAMALNQLSQLQQAANITQMSTMFMNKNSKPAVKPEPRIDFRLTGPPRKQGNFDHSRLGQHRPGRNSHYRDDMKPYRHSNGGNKRYVERRGYGGRGNRRGYAGKKGGHPGRHGWDNGERSAGRGNSRQYNRGFHRGHNDRVDGRGQNFNVGHRDNRDTDRYHGRNNQGRTGHGQERQRDEQAGNGNMDGTGHRDGTPFEMMNEKAIEDNYSLE